MAMGTFVLGLVLNHGGFAATAAAQTAQGQGALISVYTWLPGIFIACSALIMSFYRLDRRYPEIISELRERRERQMRQAGGSSDGRAEANGKAYSGEHGGQA